MNDGARAVRVIAAAIGGIGIGALLMYSSWFVVVMSSSIFANVHPPAKQIEFAMSGGEDAYFLCLALGVFVGAFALLRRKMSPEWRAFCIGAALPLLGFFALCSAISIGDLTSTPHL